MQTSRRCAGSRQQTKGILARSCPRLLSSCAGRRCTWSCCRCLALVLSFRHRYSQAHLGIVKFGPGEVRALPLAGGSTEFFFATGSASIAVPQRGTWHRQKTDNTPIQCSKFFLKCYTDASWPGRMSILRHTELLLDPVQGCSNSWATCFV